ncbi:hypothetical protein F4V43_00095 [Paenibacillus spiritus]|uniref:Copper amine oxidase-like N-terminal domain-containing protein n=1 Tax=Paenibacillus spiritus TaxID=2496557 RepID=A0A5J5GM54_9BACL|nr:MULTISPECIES: stalk domain-containing protein [Paenibacillus]KAA9008572.1 hypothetical protein F4V43_00095 [Paenibacillus spiritus]
MQKKWIAAGTAALVFMCTAAGAYAGANLKPIKAFLNPSMKFQVNGQPFQPQNDNGAVLAPIVYNNTTYLPVRSMSKALGVAIDYNQQTNTIYLGEKAEGVSVAGTFSGDFRTKDPQLTTYGDKDYKDVFFNNSSGTRGASFMLYPKGKYTKLYLQVAAVGKDVEEIFVQDADTDIKLKIGTVAVSEGIKTFEVDISGVNDLFVHADVKSGGSLFVPLTTSFYK